MDEVGALAEQIAALETSLRGAQSMAAAFDSELGRVGESFSLTEKDAGRLTSGMGRGLKTAFDGVIFGGEKLSDSLSSLARSLVSTVYNTAMQPVQSALGSSLSSGIEGIVASLLPFASGGSFSQGRIMPFAQGGVVSGPTAFPMRGATGLMGEAGPEAIMPLTRGADGRLGVRSEGAGTGGVSVVMNITTTDAQSFQRSQGQIAADMGRAISRGQRNR